MTPHVGSRRLLAVKSPQPTLRVLRHEAEPPRVRVTFEVHGVPRSLDVRRGLRSGTLWAL